MLDFTKNVKLEGKQLRLYRLARLLVFAAFILGAIYYAHLLLFPSQSFDFSFMTPGAAKNTIVYPRDSESNLMVNGELPKEKNLLFDTALWGDFSKIKLDIVLEKQSSPPGFLGVSARKSFRAFFYPEGEQMGFKDGMLVKNSGSFYIISGGKARKFASSDIARKLGFDPQTFKEVSNEELKYNEAGENITDVSEYPDDSLFKIGEEYYRLENGVLSQFVSEKAYLTNYDNNQAIEKESGFLNNYQIAEDFLGFNDGTLVSFDISAFIASQGKLFPINNIATFESMGFNWQDLVPASGEEIGIYEKAKLFNIDQPHPDGIIFSDKETGKYYYIQGGQKRELKGSGIINSYLRKSPVLAEQKGLEAENRCELKKSWGISRTYSCEIPIENTRFLLGNDYQFKMESDSDIVIKKAGARFEKSLTWENLKLSLSDIKKRIIANYYGQY